MSRCWRYSPPISLGCCMLMLAVLWAPRPARAQIAVIDASAVAQLIQSTASLAQLVGLNIRDLSVLANLAPVMQLLADLQAVVTQIQQIGTTVETQVAQWGVLTQVLPTSAYEYAQWIIPATQWSQSCTQTATQGASLIRQSIGLVNALLALVGSVSALAGTTSGLQLVSGLLGAMNGELYKLQGIFVPFQQALLSNQMIEQVSVLVDRQLKVNRMQNWGTISRWWP